MEGRILYTVHDNKKSRRRNSAKKIWVWVVLFSFIAILASAVYLLKLPYWQIKKVKVDGSVVLDQDEIKSKVNDFVSVRKFFLFPQGSYPLFDANNLALLLKQKFPRLEQVLIRKIFPDLLEVVVKERELFGVFCRQECVYIDKSGFAYESAPVSSGSLLLKIKSDVAEAGVGSTVLEPDLMNDFISLSDGLEKVLGIRPAAYEFLSKVSSEIKVETNDGLKIIFKRNDDFENALRVLKTVLEQEVRNKRSRVEYIDLRFGNKVFYKFR